MTSVTSRDVTLSQTPVEECDGVTHTRRVSRHTGAVTAMRKPTQPKDIHVVPRDPRGESLPPSLLADNADDDLHTRTNGSTPLWPEQVVAS